jgi:glyoxalase family protein
LRLALVGIAAADSGAAWTNGDIPAEHTIRGFHSVTLMLETAEPTGAILTGVFDFKQTGRDGSLVRYETRGGPGNVVIIRRRAVSCLAEWAEGRCTTSPFGLPATGCRRR